jgi:hypothetical protein
MLTDFLGENFRVDVIVALVSRRAIFACITPGVAPKSGRAKTAFCGRSRTLFGVNFSF